MDLVEMLLTYKNQHPQAKFNEDELARYLVGASFCEAQTGIQVGDPIWVIKRTEEKKSGRIRSYIVTSKWFFKAEECTLKQKKASVSDLKRFGLWSWGTYEDAEQALAEYKRKDIENEKGNFCNY